MNTQAVKERDLFTCTSRPKDGTQLEKVLTHLETHGSITSWDAIERYHATRLSSIIFILKNTYGKNIVSEMVEVDTSMGYGKTTIAKYVLR